MVAANAIPKRYECYDRHHFRSESLAVVWKYGYHSEQIPNLTAAMQSMPPSQRLLKIAFLICTIKLAACTTLTDLRSDYDAKSDFGTYTTYNFIADTEADADGYARLFAQYMTEAIAIEMEKRGYVRSSDPDLLVDSNAILEEKAKISRQAASAYAHHSYRKGYYDPWRRYGYAAQSQALQYTYTEGTFSIDIIDARKKRLVFTAAGVGRVPQQDVKEFGRSVKEGVPRFFESYLFIAGDPNPVTRQ